MNTKLNQVDFGFNQYCGPAVMSILTGKSTDECAAVIQEVTGRGRIDAVDTVSLIKAFNKLGYLVEDMKSVTGTLYGLLVRIAKQDGLYLVGIRVSRVMGHIVAVEVKDRQIYFCDNHSKVVIPAASSARLMQTATSCIRLKEPPPPTPLQLWEARQEKLHQRQKHVNWRINDINADIQRLMADRSELEIELDKIREELESHERSKPETSGS